MKDMELSSRLCHPNNHGLDVIMNELYLQAMLIIAHFKFLDPILYIKY